MHAFLARTLLALTLLHARELTAAPAKPGKAAPALGAAPVHGTRTADDILADYVAAIGGETPWAAHHVVTMVMQVSVTGMGIGGVATITETDRDEFLVELELPVIGAVRTGSDGRKIWSQDPINGLRLVTGAEAEQARLQSTWSADTRLHKLFKTIRVVAPPDPALECVELVGKSTSPIKRCFDTKTHLNTTIEMIAASPQGPTPSKVTLSDYREIGGVKFPFDSSTAAGPLTMQMTVKSITWDGKVDRSMFRLPKPAGASSTAKKAAAP